MRVTVAMVGVAMLTLTGLFGCGNPAATPDREQVGASRDDAGRASRATRYARDDGGDRSGSSRARRSRDAAASVSATLPGGGRWAASRSRSAEESAQRQFARNGGDFGAATVDAYVARAAAFVTSPPAGTLTASRSNGDRLLYDPGGNVFAVATRDGAPRTMFKPRDGMTYWREQEQRIASGGSSRTGGGRAADD